jgi:hypothetical protein
MNEGGPNSAFRRWAGRLRLAGVIGWVLVVIAAGVVLPSRARTGEWYREFSYFFLLATFLLWVSSVPRYWLDRERLRGLLSRHVTTLGLAAVLVVLLVFTSPPKFRVLADEVNLLGISSAMYDSRKTFNPTQAFFFYGGIQEELEHQWDIRPVFFPFLIHLAHVCTGYRPENAFLVNSLAGFAALSLWYFLLSRWFSTSLATVGMALLAVVPVFALWVTSGGFEIVNLAMALLAFLLLARLARATAEPASIDVSMPSDVASSIASAATQTVAEPTVAAVDAPAVAMVAPATHVGSGAATVSAPASTPAGEAEDPVEIAEFLGLTLVLLAQVRYESGLYLIVMIPLILFLLGWSGLSRITWRTFLLPVTVLPMIWHRLMIESRHYLLPGVTEVFSPTFFLKHLGPAWQFWSGARPEYGMIPGIFWGCLLALLAAGPYLWVHRRTLRRETRVVLSAATGAFLLYCGILLSYYMGDLTKQWTIRLGIIFLPSLIAPVVWGLSRLTDNGTRGGRAVVAVILALGILYWPVAGKNAYVREIIRFREFEICRAFLASRFPQKDVLLVTDYPNLFVPLRYSAVNIAWANQNERIIREKQRHLLYQKVVAVQVVSFRDHQPTPETGLNKTYHLRTLYQTQISGDHRLRFSEILPNQLPNDPNR